MALQDPALQHVVDGAADCREDAAHELVVEGVPVLGAGVDGRRELPALEVCDAVRKARLRKP